MNIEFLSTVAVIAPNPAASRALYAEALGLPLVDVDTRDKESASATGSG